mmetsp:Transcript_32862/g.78671  ORF Transcript_32862/g.78671 Transcript_32862/m.78671 type:complete len:201 (+) Transcript_32862:324-926(+)
MSNVRVIDFGFASSDGTDAKVCAASAASCEASTVARSARSPRSRLPPREGARGEASDGDFGEGGGAKTGCVSSLFACAASRAASVASEKCSCWASWFVKSGQEMTGRRVVRSCRSVGNSFNESLPVGGNLRPFNAKGTVVGPLTVPPKGKVPGRLCGSRCGRRCRMPPIRPGKVVPMPISFFFVAKQEIVRNSMTSWSGT